MPVVTGARVFDGVAEQLRELNVFHRDGVITEVSDRVVTPDDGDVLDAAGRVLMPGLIDAHIHAYALSVNVYDIHAAPDTLSACWATKVLSKMLDRGFTTVRDTGGADYGLHLALERDVIRGPRLYYCGRAISQTGGHVDFRDPQAHDHGFGCGCGRISLFSAVVDGVDDVRAIVRENLRRGSNFVKFTAAGGISSTADKLDSLQFSDEEVGAILDEVERHGAYATAHAHTDAGVRRAVELGVHCIEHATLIEPDTARLLAERGTYVVPTMVIHHALERDGRRLGYPEPSIAKLARVIDEQIARLQHLRDAGVVTGFGTDLLGDLEHYQLTEFELRAAVYKPHELLTQATSVNARIIGAEGWLGVIAPGAAADLLLLDGNPLEDIGVLSGQGESIAVVMQRGCVVKDRR